MDEMMQELAAQIETHGVEKLVFITLDEEGDEVSLTITDVHFDGHNIQVEVE